MSEAPFEKQGPGEMLKASRAPGDVAGESVLEEAARIVDGARQEEYGRPEDNFETIADLWTTYLAARRRAGSFGDVEAVDVANMMILLKIARATCKATRDTYVDVAGYAACGERCRLAGPS